MATEDAPLGPTPSQTVGPFFHTVLPWPDGPFVVAEGTPGAIRVRGRVTDGAGDPVPDALVEVWQADPDGRFDHPDDPRGAASRPAGFRGFGRCATDADGGYEFLTLKPGALPGEDGSLEAPHLDVTVLARGLLQRLVTRMYFPDEEAANAADPVLAGLPDDDAAALVGRPEADGGARFDIRLQGDAETPFFRV